MCAAEPAGGGVAAAVLELSSGLWAAGVRAEYRLPDSATAAASSDAGPGGGGGGGVSSDAAGGGVGAAAAADEHKRTAAELGAHSILELARPKAAQGSAVVIAPGTFGVDVRVWRHTRCDHGAAGGGVISCDPRLFLCGETLM